MVQGLLQLVMAVIKSWRGAIAGSDEQSEAKEGTALSPVVWLFLSMVQNQAIAETTKLSFQLKQT